MIVVHYVLTLQISYYKVRFIMNMKNKFGRRKVYIILEVYISVKENLEVYQLAGRSIFLYININLEYFRLFSIYTFLIHMERYIVIKYYIIKFDILYFVVIC